VISCIYCGAPATVYVPNPDGKFPYCSREHAIQHEKDGAALGIHWRVAYKPGTNEPEVFPITDAC
jgi:hypothetical protein